MGDMDVVGAIKIKDGLFLGDEFASQDLEFVVANKVTHVINCSGREVPNHWEPLGVMYLTFSWLDHDQQVILDSRMEVIDQIFNFIEESLEVAESVLIHSVRGQSRSCCVLAAYLMKRYRWSVNKALEFICSRRPDIDLKTGFLEQLSHYEKTLIQMGKGPSNLKWTDVPENPHLENEELLLRNTFLNGQMGPFAELHIHNYDPSRPRKLMWADNFTEDKNRLVQPPPRTNMNIKIPVNLKAVPTKPIMKGSRKAAAAAALAAATSVGGDLMPLGMGHALTGPQLAHHQHNKINHVQSESIGLGHHSIAGAHMSQITNSQPHPTAFHQPPSAHTANPGPMPSLAQMQTRESHFSAAPVHMSNQVPSSSSGGPSPGLSSLDRNQIRQNSAFASIESERLLAQQDQLNNSNKNTKMQPLPDYQSLHNHVNGPQDSLMNSSRGTKPVPLRSQQPDHESLPVAQSRMIRGGAGNGPRDSLAMERDGRERVFERVAPPQTQTVAPTAQHAAAMRTRDRVEEGREPSGWSEEEYTRRPSEVMEDVLTPSSRGGYQSADQQNRSAQARNGRLDGPRQFFGEESEPFAVGNGNVNGNLMIAGYGSATKKVINNGRPPTATASRLSRDFSPKPTRVDQQPVAATRRDPSPRSSQQRTASPRGPPQPSLPNPNPVRAEPPSRMFVRSSPKQPMPMERPSSSQPRIAPSSMMSGLGMSGNSPAPSPSPALFRTSPPMPSAVNNNSNNNNNNNSNNNTANATDRLNAYRYGPIRATADVIEPRVNSSSQDFSPNLGSIARSQPIRRSSPSPTPMDRNQQNLSMQRPSTAPLARPSSPSTRTIVKDSPYAAPLNPLSANGYGAPVRTPPAMTLSNESTRKPSPSVRRPPSPTPQSIGSTRGSSPGKPKWRI